MKKVPSKKKVDRESEHQEGTHKERKHEKSQIRRKRKEKHEVKNEEDKKGKKFEQGEFLLTRNYKIRRKRNLL